VRTVLLKAPRAESDALDACLRHAEESTVAAYLAERFNADAEVRALLNFKAVSFLRVHALLVHGMDGEERAFCMEERLQVRCRGAGHGSVRAAVARG
jgi:hypothetical protein